MLLQMVQLGDLTKCISVKVFRTPALNVYRLESFMCIFEAGDHNFMKIT